MKTNEEPQFVNISNDDIAFKKTIIDAQSTLPNFKEILKNLPDNTYSCVKVYLPESTGSNQGAYMWLMNPYFEERFCYAQPFELPKELTWIEVGQWIEFDEKEIMDWYLLNDSGELRGGYSLRYQRSLIAEEKKLEFDRRICVKVYL
jgi:uncharacterized protein YegJ (DUF2314 family)